MSDANAPHSMRSRLIALIGVEALPFWVLILLALSLVVYPTSLNPGLPLILSSLLLAVGGVLRLAKGSGPYYSHGMDVAVGLLAWMVLATVLVGLDGYLAQRSLYTFAGAVGIITILQCSTRSSRRPRVVAYAFLLFNAFFSLWAWQRGLAAAFQTGDIPPLTGQFVNPDTFSVLPMLALLVGLGLVERCPKKFLLPLCGLLSFFLLTVLATGCRAALVGIAVGGSCFFALTLGFQKEKFDQSKVLLAVPLLLAFLLLPLSALSFSTVKKYVTTLSGDALVSEAVRLEVSTHGWLAAARKPILGAGPGCFGLSYQAVRPPDQDPHYVNIAHNDFIEMAVECGFVGFVLWLALYGFALSKTFRSAKRGRRPFLAAALLGAVVSGAVYSLFNFVVAERPALWAFAFVLGMALTFPSSRRQVREPMGLRVGASIFLIVLSGFSLLFGVKSLKADRHLAQASGYFAALLHEDALAQLEQAIALQPKRAHLYLEAAENARFLAGLSGQTSHQEARRRYLEGALRASPYSTNPYLLLSQLSQETGDFEAAERYLDQAFTLAPNLPHLYTKKISFAVRRGDLKQAYLILGDLVTDEKHPRFPQLKAVLLQADYRDPGSTAEALSRWHSDPKKAVWLPALLRELATDAFAAKRWKSAEFFTESALKEHPEDLCLAVQAARLVGELGNETAELTELQTILEENAGLDGACLKGAFERWLSLLKSTGSLREAEPFLERQVENYPSLFAYRMALSESYEQQGDLDRAQRVIRDGLIRGVPTAQVYFRLGEVYEKSGSRPLATSYYRKALDLDPKYPQAKRRLDALLR